MSLVTESDCVRIISRKLGSSNFKIQNFIQKPQEEKNGFLGEHYKLEIIVLRGGVKEKYTYFLKSPPGVPSQREYLEQINGDLKEEQFYNKYLSLLNQYGIDVILGGAIPKCYLAKDNLLVLEDLKEQGFYTMNSRDCLDFDHLKAALSVLARLHASGLIFEEKSSTKLDALLNLEESFYSVKPLPRKALTAAITGLRALIEVCLEESHFREEFTKWAVLQAQNLPTMVKPGPFRSTICHGDAWTKNFMFFDKKKAVLLDFQAYHYVPPAQDMMAFMYFTTDTTFRELHLRDCIDFYYQELDRNLEKFDLGNLISRTDFDRSVEYYRKFALLQSINHFQIICLSEESAREMFKDPETALNIIFSDKSEFMRDVCRRDEVFKSKLADCFQELCQLYRDER